MKNFADRLLNAIDNKQNPSCIGLDPRFNKIPSFIKQEQKQKYGPTFEAVGASLFNFNQGIIDAVYDIIPTVKPQMAFYEQYGTEGVKAFEKTVNYAKQKGLLVIEDAKRNDIGSTAQAYADGHLGKVDFWDGNKAPNFDVDALTVNAYLGFDGIKPFIENCKEYGKGLFILVKTSNNSSSELQDIEVSKGCGRKFYGYIPTVYTKMAELVKEWGQEVIGERGYSSIGAVVGATYPEQAKIARRIIKNAIFLVPGYGAQGATAKEITPNFNSDGYGAIISSSREIIFAYQRKFQRNESDYDKAARDAALFMKEDITLAIKETGIL